jgi:hypothetical protein
MKLKWILLALFYILTVAHFCGFAHASFPDCMESFYETCDQFKAEDKTLDDVLVEITDTTEFCVFPPMTDTECEINARITQYWEYGIKASAPTGSYYGQHDWNVELQELQEEADQLKTACEILLGGK